MVAGRNHTKFYVVFNIVVDVRTIFISQMSYKCWNFRIVMLSSITRLLYTTFKGAGPVN